MEQLKPNLFFHLDEYEHRELFSSNNFVWEALKNLVAYCKRKALGNIQVDVPPDVTLVNPAVISIGKGTKIEQGAYIEGPCIIGQDCEIRQGAYVRSYVVTGNGCILGHATEIKHSILLDRANAAHFNYVGDSILGNDTNLGAGVICANLRLDHKPISIRDRKIKMDTQLTKLGLILGDHSQIGCNCVTNPGTILGKSTVYEPCQSIKGVILSKPSLTSLKEAASSLHRKKDETSTQPKKRI